MKPRTEAASAVAGTRVPQTPQPLLRAGSPERAPLLPPLPPPEHLAAYEATLEGAADRFLRLWEQEAAHRIEMEELEPKAERAAQVREVWHTYILILAALGAGAWLAASGSIVVGGVIAVFGLARLTVLNLPMARRSRIRSGPTGAQPGSSSTPPGSRPPTP